jgi:hypothetical protein
MAIASRALAALTGTLGALVVMPPAQAADADFLTKVHVAASYGLAASKLAQTTGDAAVRKIGAKVAAQDAQLETRVRAAAAKLKVQLPAADPALPAQQLTGKAMSAAYIDRLRSTDGALLQLAASVRVNTRDQIVRDLAQHTATTMMTQLPLLESSGLIDLAALPTPTSAAPSAPPKSGPNMDPSLLAKAREGKGFLWPALHVILLILAVALAGAGIAAWRLFTPSARTPSARTPSGRAPGRRRATR